MTLTIDVRPATDSDLDALVGLEQSAWSTLGTPILGRCELAAWLNESSPFFLIAEEDGVPCGYYFGRLVAFSLKEHVSFFDPSLMTGQGWSLHAHDPHGKSLYGINIVSVRPGTGRILYEAVQDLMEVMCLEYSVGITRLSGLNRYLATIETMGGGRLPCNQDMLALWYAHENATILGMRTWAECVPKPELHGLPPIRKPDPVLAFHVRGTSFGLLGILPGYIVPDPESRDYGAMIVSRAPHRL